MLGVVAMIFSSVKPRPLIDFFPCFVSPEGICIRFSELFNFFFFLMFHHYFLLLPLHFPFFMQISVRPDNQFLIVLFC